MRPMMAMDWTRHAAAIKKAVTDGAELILVGEDMGLDPATGLAAGFEGDGPTIRGRVANAMGKALWQTVSADGEIVRATLGKGSLILCRNTPDGVGHTWGDAVEWQKKFLAALAAPTAAPVGAAPTAERLRLWLSSGQPLAKGPRTTVWRGEWKQSLNAAVDPVGPVFEMRLPPAGDIKEAVMEIVAAGKSSVVIDVGADGSVEAECKPGDAPAVAWTEAIRKYLAWRKNSCGGVDHDLNGWRLVPIRFSSSGQAEVVVRSTKIIVE